MPGAARSVRKTYAGTVENNNTVVTARNALLGRKPGLTGGVAVLLSGCSALRVGSAGSVARMIRFCRRAGVWRKRRDAWLGSQLTVANWQTDGWRVTVVCRVRCGLLLWRRRYYKRAAYLLALTLPTKRARFRVSRRHFGYYGANPLPPNSWRNLYNSKLIAATLMAAVPDATLRWYSGLAATRIYIAWRSKYVVAVTPFL